MTFPVIGMLMDIRISDQLVAALCNTLVHSLWQGVLLAVVGGMIVIGTQRSSSVLRYNLLTAALSLFAAGVITTFILQLTVAENVPVVAGMGQVLPRNAAASYAYHPGADAPFINLTNILSGYLNNHHDIIVLVWFLIICARSIQLGIGLHATYRMRYVKALAASGPWQVRLQELAGALGIQRSITLLESGLAKVPLVFGHLKPVILLPAGLLTALPSGEIEAILRHELAHIYRRDFLVNLLQNLMEILFFFNPAVLWVSQLIKTERENCCDDLVLRETNSKANYIRALLSCQERWAEMPAQAMAFPGGKNGLLHRVRRMTNNRNHSLSLAEKTLLAVCLVVSGICVSAFIPKTVGKQEAGKVEKIVREGRRNVAAVKNIEKHDRKPARLSGVEPIRQTAGTSVPQTGELTARQELYGEEELYDTMPMAAMRDRAASYLSSAHDYEKTRTHYKYTSRMYPYASMGDKEKAELKEILSDMVKDGIITSPACDLVFRLTGKEFVVNGEPQKEEVFQRYKQKFVPGDGENDWQWTHSQHNP